jgi:hypothetical protein
MFIVPVARLTSTVAFEVRRSESVSFEDHHPSPRQPLKVAVITFIWLPTLLYPYFSHIPISKDYRVKNSLDSQTSKGAGVQHGACAPAVQNDIFGDALMKTQPPHFF